MSNHSQDLRDQWREIEASLGGRFNDGNECPPFVVLYRVARAEGRGTPEPPEARQLRDHINHCGFCRRTFESARDVAMLPPEAGPPSEVSAATPAPERLIVVGEQSQSLFESALSAFRPAGQLPVPVTPSHGTDIVGARASASVRDVDLAFSPHPPYPYRPPGAVVLSKPVAVSLGLTAAACVVVCVALFGNSVKLQNERSSLERIIVEKDGMIRMQTDRVESLSRAVDQSALRETVKLADPKAFRIAGNRIEVEGEINPTFIRDVRVRWGTEPDGSYTTLLQGAPEPDPEGTPRRFSAASPELRLDGRSLVATLEFVPYPAMQRAFSEYFTPEKMHYSRSFLLAREGIQPDPGLVAILAPRDGGRVQQFDEVEGRFDAREGWPVIMVQPLVGDGSWWIEPTVTEVEEGRFSATCHFGTDQTRPGTKFRVVIVVTRSRAEAEEMPRRGMTRTVLPPGLLHSSPITVVRE